MAISRIPKTRKEEKGLFSMHESYSEETLMQIIPLGRVRICLQFVLNSFKVKSSVKVVYWQFSHVVKMLRKLEFDRVIPEFL